MGNTPAPRSRALDDDQRRIQHLMEDLTLGPHNNGMHTARLRRVIKERHPHLTWTQIPGKKKQALNLIVDLESIPHRQSMVHRANGDMVRKILHSQLAHTKSQSGRIQDLDRRLQSALHRSHAGASEAYMDAVVSALNRSQKELDTHKLALRRMTQLLEECTERLSKCTDCAPWETCIENKDSASSCLEAIREKYPDVVPVSTSSMKQLDVPIPDGAARVRMNTEKMTIRTTKTKEPTRDTYVKLPDLEKTLNKLRERIADLENNKETPPPTYPGEQAPDGSPDETN